jgi:hypothetical protein
MAMLLFENGAWFVVGRERRRAGSDAPGSGRVSNLTAAVATALR